MWCAQQKKKNKKTEEFRNESAHIQMMKFPQTDREFMFQFFNQWITHTKFIEILAEIFSIYFFIAKVEISCWCSRKELGCTLNPIRNVSVSTNLCVTHSQLIDDCGWYENLLLVYVHFKLG